MKRSVDGQEKKKQETRKESGERKRIRGAKGIHQWLLLGVRISQPLTSAHFWDRSNAVTAKLLFLNLRLSLKNIYQCQLNRW